MAILPTNFLNNIMTRTDTAANQGNIQAAALSVSDANRLAILDLINSLSPGDTLVGKVLYADSENLSLQTKEGLILNAKNGSEIPLMKGESVAFEVERTTRKSVTLRPLFQNTAKDQTAVIALRQAGIPVNGRSVEATVRNMQYGMNVDRDSLLSSYKDVSLYPEAPVKNIIDLQRMGIEVNELTLKQYESYQNSENLISDALSTISSNISDAISDELLDMLPSLKEFVPLSEEQAILLQGQDNEPSLLERLNASYLNSTKFEFPEKSILNTVANFANQIKDLPSLDEVNVSRGELEILKDTIKSLDLPTNNLDKVELKEEYTSPSNTLEAFLMDIKDNASNISNAAKLIGNDNQQILEFNNQLSGFENMIKSAVIDNLVKRTFMSQWSLNKDKIGSQTEIKDLYDRLYDQTRNLTNMLQSAGINNTNISNPVNNLAENLQFMDAMNQFVPYVQIPFHDGDNNKTSELYVFTNKKNLAQKDGEISAFIHLDMNNIGPTDVYVKLSNGQHISTKFTLRDDEVLDFIGQHIDLLEKRIKERGYTFNAEMSKMEDNKPSIEKALDNTTQKLLIANTSFDARV